MCLLISNQSKGIDGPMRCDVRNGGLVEQHWQVVMDVDTEIDCVTIDL